MIRKTLSILLLVALCSCSSFKEVHYFSDNTPGVPNYYRVKVSGVSIFSSSRYLSGYFDPDAVNQYFNEIKQPEQGRLNIPDLGQTGPTDSLGNSLLGDSTLVEREYSPLLAQENRERLVLVYSTNSDAVSNQIGLITQNENTMDALAYLLFDKDLEDQANIEVQHAVSQSRHKLLMDLGKPLVEDLDPDNDPQAKVYSSLLQYLNTLALELGNTSPFANMDEAEEWLEKNRSGILKSNK